MARTRDRRRIQQSRRIKHPTVFHRFHRPSENGRSPFSSNIPEWSARLPQAEQDSLAAGLLAKGAPVNLIQFAPKSVLPADGKGSEHMYSFDFAYKITPVREWLFRQSR